MRMGIARFITQMSLLCVGTNTYASPPLHLWITQQQGVACHAGRAHKLLWMHFLLLVRQLVLISNQRLACIRRTASPNGSPPQRAQRVAGLQQLTGAAVAQGHLLESCPRSALALRSNTGAHALPRGLRALPAPLPPVLQAPTLHCHICPSKCPYLGKVIRSTLKRQACWAPRWPAANQIETRMSQEQETMLSAMNEALHEAGVTQTHQIHVILDRA